MDSTELEALRRHNRVNRILDLTGKTLISAGLLLLLFVAYQLWGTGLAERQAQDKLKSQFVTTTTQPTTTPTNVPTTTLAPVTPKKGDVVAQILIDSIKVDKFVIAGVGYKELEKGPGLFTGSPLPGQFGNVAIAGHRTTYGAPFSRLDELKTGDRIVMKTSQASYTYIVSNAPKIVKATDVDVIRTVDATRATLTLVTCHPKWTSEKRLIISAELEPKFVAQKATLFVTTEDNAPEEVLTDGWFHDPSALPIVIVYALFLALIVIVANRLARKKWRGVIVYPVAAVVFLPTLFVFFTYLTRLLPTNL